MEITKGVKLKGKKKVTKKEYTTKEKEKGQVGVQERKTLHHITIISIPYMDHIPFQAIPKGPISFSLKKLEEADPT